MSSSRITVAVLGLAAALLAGDASAQTGAIAGIVTRADTQTPLEGVQVFVAGTNRTALTNQQGRYLIPGLQAGTYTVRASIIGYEQGEQSATVSAGGTATADFAVRETALELGAIVVNAVTGQIQTKREVASAVGKIDVAKVELAPVGDMGQLIQGRVAGAVVLQSSGTTGTGSRIRIRGSNSISLSNAPLVIVDNVRVASSEASLGFGVGGQNPSRLNDLNPEDIESIDILKGPAASSLYGTAAANGVIVVTTRRGRAGASHFRVWAEYGELDDATSFPDNVFAEGSLIGGAGTNVPPGAIGRCDVVRRAVGANPGPGQIGCTGITDTFRFNPLENGETTPFRTGNRQTLGGSVSGGTEAARYYVSGEYEEEGGVLSDNNLRRVRVQANLNGDVGRALTVGGSFSYLESNLQLPTGDNALFGIVPMGLSGSALPEAVEDTKGFASDPAFHDDWKTFQDFSRFTGSVRGDWRPMSWLTVNGVVGLDRYAFDEVNRIPRENAFAVFGSIYTSGWIQKIDDDVYNVTSTSTASAIFNPRSDLVSTTSAGASYSREDSRELYAFGATLTPGIETSLAGASTDHEVDEGNVKNATLGLHLQQQLAWRDRVFLNGALRSDKNTAFGADIGWIWYPAVSGAWVVSEEPFFPVFDWLSSVRLRTAWGQSGLRPGPTAALQSFSGQIGVFNNQAVPAIVINAIGNADLKPERSTEWEAGLDLGFLDGRLGVEATYFRKVSKDALVNKPLPPTAGGSASRFENIGRVDNSGYEFLLNASPVRTTELRWNASIGGSFVKNELVDLGTDAAGEPIPPIVFGLLTNTQRHAEGYAPGGFWHFPYTYDDADGDGLLKVSEITVDTDTVTFLGNPFPKREFTFSTDVGFRDWLRLSALMDYKGGHHLINFTRAFRCGDSLNCAEVYDPNTPLEDQAAILAFRAAGSVAGFIEEADFLKLREVALTVALPSELARRVRAQRLSLTLAGRNLKTWTDYRGFDPEVAFSGQSNFTSGDEFTLPPNRVWTIRVETNF